MLLLSPVPVVANNEDADGDAVKAAVRSSVFQVAVPGLFKTFKFDCDKSLGSDLNLGSPSSSLLPPVSLSLSCSLAWARSRSA